MALLLLLVGVLPALLALVDPRLGVRRAAATPTVAAAAGTARTTPRCARLGHLECVMEADVCRWRAARCVPFVTPAPTTPSPTRRPAAEPSSPVASSRCAGLGKSACKRAAKRGACAWSAELKACAAASTASPTPSPSTGAPGPASAKACARFGRNVGACCGAAYAATRTGPCANALVPGGCRWLDARCSAPRVKTSAPSKATKSPVAVVADTASLLAWQSLYDTTDGAKWTACSGLRDAPCACDEVVGTRTIHVTCTSIGVIAAVSMRANRLSCAFFPVVPIQALFAAGMTSVDLSDNERVRGGSPCVLLPQCLLAGNTCDFSPYDVCTDVQSLDSPSARPTRAVGGTQPSAPTTANAEYESGVILSDLTTPPTPADAGYGDPCETLSDCEGGLGLCKGGFCCGPAAWAYNCMACVSSTGLCASCVAGSVLIQDGSCVLVSPTARPTDTLGPAAQSLALWEQFYDVMRGPEWLACSTDRGEPCACDVTVGSRVMQVQCDQSGVITSIVLRANHLKAPYFPQAVVEAMFATGLRTFDVGDNAAVEYVECVDLPQCYEAGYSCDVSPGELCAQTRR